MTLSRAELEEEERLYWEGTSPRESPATAIAARVVRVSEVEREPVEWLWQDRLARGKLVVLDGDPALLKSTMTLDWSARITTGTPWPDGAPMGAIGSVVLLTAEDGIADTVRPRLEAHGADLTRVVVFDAVPTVDDDGNPGPERPPSIPADLEVLEALVVREGAVLVVIDPLSAFLGSRVDSHKDQDIRGALMPVAKIAERTGACVVIVRHLAKAGGANPLYRGGGSIGIIGAARAGMLVAPDPEDENRRILCMTKNNLAAIPPALAYRALTDEEFGCARIAWDGTTAHKAADLLAIAGAHDDEQVDAAAVLTEVLADGAVWVKEALDRMAEAGFSKDQAKRAKGKIHARSVKVGKPGDDITGWKWELLREQKRVQGCEGSAIQNATPLAPLEPELLPSER